MKREILSALVVCVLLALNCAGSGSLTLTNYSQVVSMLDSIKEWTDNRNYTAADWSHVIRVARIIQQSNPKTVQEGLAEFIQDNDTTNAYYFNQTKPYLLLRVLFDLPTNAPNADRFSFANFVTFGKEINADGTVNLSWPVGWKDGMPYLYARCWGAEGPPPYQADEEYVYMREHFKYRRLPQER